MARKRTAKPVASRKGHRGQPPHVPTDEGRSMVQQMARIGLPEEKIAEVVGVTRPTLRKHYKEELRNGKNAGTVQLLQTAYNMALRGHWPALNRLISIRIPEFSKGAEDAAAEAAAAEAEANKPTAVVEIEMDLGPAVIERKSTGDLPEELAEYEQQVVIDGTVSDRQIH